MHSAQTNTLVNGQRFASIDADSERPPLKGSGLCVLRNLADAHLPAKRVVLTNYATSDMRERCGALGALRVFDKSCGLDDLISYCARLSSRGGGCAPGGPAG